MTFFFFKMTGVNNEPVAILKYISDTESTEISLRNCDFFVECRRGVYGELCSMSCGNCKDGVHCNASNGACPGECENGFELPTCNESEYELRNILKSSKLCAILADFRAE